jgi:murein DD-endopeptidase MepM/ murein hydrolase activator NlpD
MKYRWFIFGALVIGLGWWLATLPATEDSATPATDAPLVTEDSPTPPTTPATESKLVEPINEFFARITKKPFGIYITPTTSPVSPEKFTGYHTAVDVEYGDVESDVLVRAAANGKVVVSRTATGYGGVLVIDHRPDFSWFSLYGHLDPTSLPRLGTEVLAGDIVGKLAPAFSVQSGGERKHLHFGIIAKSTPDLAGYVQTEAALTGWLDPVAIIPK